MQAAPASTDEVKPLLEADTLSPKTNPGPTPGPTSVAEQLDAMKGAGPTLQTSSLPKEEPKVDLFKEVPKEAELESEAAGVSPGGVEPQNPVDASVPGTEIAPDHPGASPFKSLRLS